MVKYLICVGVQPIWIVETSWFPKFLKVALPFYKMPSKYVIHQSLNSLQEIASKKLIEEISKLKFRPSVTVDTWTGKNHKGFMGTIIHYCGKS